MICSLSCYALQPICNHYAVIRRGELLPSLLCHCMEHTRLRVGAGSSRQSTQQEQLHILLRERKRAVH